MERLLEGWNRFCRALVSAWRYLKRRDAGIPLDFIKVLRLNPGDVVVVRGLVSMTSDQIDLTYSNMKKILRERNDVLVLDGRWNMEIIRCEEQKSP